MGIGLIALGAIAMIAGDLTLNLPRTLGLGVPAVVIIAGAIVLEPLFRARSLGALRVLGDASYALYLTHLIVMVAMQRVVAGWERWIAGPVVLALCLAAALATYYYVERPVLKWARGLDGRERRAIA